MHVLIHTYTHTHTSYSTHTNTHACTHTQTRMYTHQTYVHANTLQHCPLEASIVYLIYNSNNKDIIITQKSARLCNLTCRPPLPRSSSRKEEEMPTRKQKSRHAPSHGCDLIWPGERPP